MCYYMCISFILVYYLLFDIAMNVTSSKLYVVVCVIIANDSSWVCLSVVVRHTVQMKKYNFMQGESLK